MGCLGESGSRDGGIGDHFLVVSKHVALGVDGYTKIHECQADGNDLVNSSSCNLQPQILSQLLFPQLIVSYSANELGLH